MLSDKNREVLSLIYAAVEEDSLYLAEAEDIKTKRRFVFLGARMHGDHIFIVELAENSHPPGLYDFNFAESIINGTLQ